MWRATPYLSLVGSSPVRAVVRAVSAGVPLLVEGTVDASALGVSVKSSVTTGRTPRKHLQKLRKQVSLFRSCTLCVQGLAQKPDLAEPPCRPPSLTLSVHGAREGPAARAQVSSLRALPYPLPWVSDPLGGTDTLPCPSSLGNVTVAALVKLGAKRPRAAAGR